MLHIYCTDRGRTWSHALQSANKNILLNVVILFVESNESHNNDSNMITATVVVKVVTTTHRQYCKSNIP